MIEDIILREVSNPPLTTKGSQLTWEELDGNFIEIFNAVMENYLSSYVGAYDNGATYDNAVKNYAVYGSVIWKYIHASPSVGVTPGTDVTRWVQKFAADLAHKKNSDTILAEGTADEVSAADLAILVNQGAKIFEFDETIPAADMLTAYEGDTPVKMITHAGGVYAGKKIKVIAAEVENLIELSPPSTPYATNLTMSLKTDGAGRPQMTFSNILNATVSRMASGAAQGISGATDTQLIADADVYANVLTGNPTAGDYDVRVTGTYKYV